MLAVGSRGGRRSKGPGTETKGLEVAQVSMLEVFTSFSMLLSVLCEEMCRNSILYPFNTVSLTFPFLFHFFQNSLIKRIQGENVYVKHSNLMLEVGIGIYQCMYMCVSFSGKLWICTMMHELCTPTC